MFEVIMTVNTISGTWCHVDWCISTNSLEEPVISMVRVEDEGSSFPQNIHTYLTDSTVSSQQSAAFIMYIAFQWIQLEIIDAWFLAVLDGFLIKALSITIFIHDVIFMYSK